MPILFELNYLESYLSKRTDPEHWVYKSLDLSSPPYLLDYYIPPPPHPQSNYAPWLFQKNLKVVTKIRKNGHNQYSKFAAVALFWFSIQQFHVCFFKVIGNKWEAYLVLLQAEYQEGDALDALGLKR